MLLGVLASGLLTSLQLAASLYSLAVHDHALAHGDAGALLLLTCLAVGLHGLGAALDLARGRVLARAGLALARSIERRTLAHLSNDRKRGMAALGDVDRVAHYLAGAGPAALLDALWLPASLVAIALLHPALALFALVAAMLMVGLAVRVEAKVERAGSGAQDVRRRRFALGGGPRQPDDGPVRNWRRHAVSRSYYRTRGAVAEVSLSGGAVARGVRLGVQSLGFGLGALLVIGDGLTVGQLFAWSLIANRAFASLDAALSQWRGLAAARASFRRLAALERSAEAADEAQILNSSMLANAVRSASDQSPESFLKYASSWKMRFSRRASRLSRS